MFDRRDGRSKHAVMGNDQVVLTHIRLKKAFKRCRPWPAEVSKAQMRRIPGQASGLIEDIEAAGGPLSSRLANGRKAQV